MLKRRSVVAVDVNVEKPPKKSKSDQNEEEIDWTRCFICQKDETERLQSSSQAMTGDKEQPYKELAKRILKFESINLLPVPIDIEKLKQGGFTLEYSLINHEAQFHKTCKNKFGKDKLERAKAKYEKARKS